MAACLLAALLFGASTPALKLILSEMSPLGAAGLLYLGAAAGVLPSALRGPRARPSKQNLTRIAGAVLFGGMLGPVLMLFGLRAAAASDVSLWLILETPATALLGVCFFAEHATRRLVLAIALMISAALLLAMPFDAANLTAVLAVAGACLCWGLDNQLTATIDAFTPSQVTLAKGLVAGTTNLALSFLLNGGPTFGASWLLVPAVGAISYGASLVLYIAGAQQLGATRSQLLFSTAPLFGLSIAWAVLGEPIEAAQIAAAVLMFTAIAVMHREPHGHRHTHAATTHTHWHRHDDAHHDHDHDHDALRAWHNHEHHHHALEHEHPHRPDIHHHHDH